MLGPEPRTSCTLGKCSTSPTKRLLLKMVKYTDMENVNTMPLHTTAHLRCKSHYALWPVIPALRRRGRDTAQVCGHLKVHTQVNVNPTQQGLKEDRHRKAILTSLILQYANQTRLKLATLVVLNMCSAEMRLTELGLSQAVCRAILFCGLGNNSQQTGGGGAHITNEPQLTTSNLR